MRHFLAILLLIAAAVHPLAHFGDVFVTCPCVHGAVVDVAPPAVAPSAAAMLAYAGSLPSFIVVDRAAEVPARGPPPAA